MGIIAYLILGLVAGLVARALIPGDQPGGLFMTMLLGILGAVSAGLLVGWLLDFDPIDEFFDVSTWVASIAGAVVVILAYQSLVNRSSGTDRRIGS